MTGVFLEKDWEKTGTEASLQKIITEVSRFPLEVLWKGDSSGMSIAKRLSWVAGRHRKLQGIEDKAYSLMGIFVFLCQGVESFNTQEGILKMSDD